MSKYHPNEFSCRIRKTWPLLLLGAMLAPSPALRAQNTFGDAPSNYPSGSSNFANSAAPTSLPSTAASTPNMLPPVSSYPAGRTVTAPPANSQTVPAGCWSGACRQPAPGAPYYYPNYGWNGWNGYNNAAWNNYYYYYPYNSSGGANPYGPTFAGAGNGDLPFLPDEGAAEEAPAQHEDLGPAAPIHKDRFWIDADYAASFIKPWRSPLPLVTFGTLAGSPPAALGQPGTTVALGNRIDFDRFDGARLGGGFFDESGCLALEASALVTIPHDERFAAHSDASGTPAIGRPFFNTQTGLPGVFLNSVPGQVAGSVNVDARSEFLSAETNLRYRCRPCDSVRIDGLMGFRFLRLQESLTIRDQANPLFNGAVTFLGNPVNVGSTLTDVDSFRTTNHYYGFQLGTEVQWEGKWLFAGAFGKIGLGACDEEVDINGSTALFTPTGVQGAGGAGLALPSNIGQHSRTAFAYVPEGGVTVGVKVTPCLRLTAGYSFLYWSSVVRPGAQINPSVNPNQVPSSLTFGQPGGPLAPTFHANAESFWMHSLLAGLEFHY